jgi:hypothetical protein
MAWAAFTRARPFCAACHSYAFFTNPDSSFIGPIPSILQSIMCDGTQVE